MGGRLRKWIVLLFLSPLLLLSLFFFLGTSGKALATPEGFSNDMVTWGDELDTTVTGPQYGVFGALPSNSNMPVPDATTAGITQTVLAAATNPSGGIAPGDGVLDAEDDRVWMGYITDVGGTPTFRMVRSGDGGQTWSAGYTGDFAVDGYFDLVYASGQIYMVYDHEGALYWRYVDNPDSGDFSSAAPLRNTDGSSVLMGRKPQMVYDGATIHVAFISGTTIGYTSIETSTPTDEFARFKVVATTPAVSSDYPACSITASNTSIGPYVDIYYNADDSVVEAHSSNAGDSFTSVTDVDGMGTMEPDFPTAVSGMADDTYTTVLFFSYRLPASDDYGLAYRVKTTTTPDVNTWGPVGDINVLGQVTSNPTTFRCLYPVNTAALFGPQDSIVRLAHSFGAGTYALREYEVDISSTPTLDDITELNKYYDVEETQIRHLGHVIEKDTVDGPQIQGSARPIIWSNFSNPPYVYPPPVNTWDNVNALSIAGVKTERAYYASIEYSDLTHLDTAPSYFTLNFKRTLWEGPQDGWLAGTGGLTASGDVFEFMGTTLASGTWGTNGTQYTSLRNKYFGGADSVWSALWGGSNNHAIFLKAGSTNFDFNIAATGLYDRNWDITGYFPELAPRRGITSPAPGLDGIVRGIAAVNPRWEQHYREDFSDGRTPTAAYPSMPEYWNEDYPLMVETYGEANMGLEATSQNGDYNSNFQARNEANKKTFNPGVYRIKLLGHGVAGVHGDSPPTAYPGLPARDVFSWLLSDDDGPTVNAGDYGVYGSTISSAAMPGITLEESPIFRASKTTAGTILPDQSNTDFFIWEENADNILYYVLATDQDIYTVGEDTGWQNNGPGVGERTTIGSGINRLEYDLDPDFSDPNDFNPNPADTQIVSVPNADTQLYKNYAFGITKDKFPNPGTLYKIRFRVYDNVGNYTQIDHQFMYDTNMPEVTGEITAPTGENGWYLDAPILTVTGDASACDGNMAYFDFVIGVSGTGSAGGLSADSEPIFTADPTQLVDPLHPELGTGLDSWYATFGISVPISACTMLEPAVYTYSFQNGAEFETWLADPLFADFLAAGGYGGQPLTIQQVRDLATIVGTEWRGGRAALYFRGVLDTGLSSKWQRVGNPEQPYKDLDRPGETTMASYWDWTLRWDGSDPVYSSNPAALAYLGPMWQVPDTTTSFGGIMSLLMPLSTTGVWDWGSYSDMLAWMDSLPDDPTEEEIFDYISGYLPTFWNYAPSEDEWHYYSGENGWYRILRPGDFLYGKPLVGGDWTSDTGAPAVYSSVFSGGAFGVTELLPEEDWIDLSTLPPELASGLEDVYGGIWPYQGYLSGGGAPFVSSGICNTDAYNPTLTLYDNVTGTTLEEYLPVQEYLYGSWSPAAVAFAAGSTGIDSAHPSANGVEIPFEGVWTTTWTGKTLAGRVVQSSFDGEPAGTATFGDDNKTYTGSGDDPAVGALYDWLAAWQDVENPPNGGDIYRRLKAMVVGVPFDPVTKYQRLPNLLGYENVLGYDKTPPEISVAPMRYDQTYVELSVTDNLSGYWKLHYTWNGGGEEITEDNPIRLDAPLPGEPNLLTCYAYDMAGNRSAEFEFNVPAQVTVEIIPPNPNVFGWYGQELIWGAGLLKPAVKLTLNAAGTGGEEGVFDMPIAAGAFFSLGLKTDGSVVGWGQNTYGQLTVPSPNSDFTAVAAGYNHSLGLKADGSVVGWGQNTYGQLNVPAPNEDFVALGAGRDFSLGVKSDGSVVGWGQNTYGQLNVPAPNEDFISVAGGTAFSVGLKADGTLVAWGTDHGYGELTVPAGNNYVAIAANGYTAAALTQSGDIVVWGSRNNIGTPPEGNFKAIALGMYTGLALAVDGSVIAWGDDRYNQVSGVPGGNDFVAIAVGDRHCIALESNGTIVGWGDNRYGQATILEQPTDAVSIGAGIYFSLVAHEDGTVTGYGDNSFGQLTVPAPNENFTMVAAGATHSLGLKSDGSVVGWGSNSYGQLNIPSPNSGFIAVAAGERHSVGLKADGSIVAWGDNTYGQCNVPAGNNFVEISTFYRHSLARRSDGTIVGWGLNTDGQCNIPAPNSDWVSVSAGYTNSQGVKSTGVVYHWGYSPQTGLPSPNSGFAKVATGRYFALGLKTDGSIVGWGQNTYGQLNVPAPNTDFVEISAGYYHSMGRKSDGTVVIWGSNGAGQAPVWATNGDFRLPSGTGFIPARPSALDHWVYNWDSEPEAESEENPLLTEPPGEAGGSNTLYFTAYTDNGQEIYGDIDLDWDLVSPAPTTDLAIGPNTGWSTWAKDYFLPMFFSSPEAGDDVPWLRNETYSMSLTAEDDRSGLWEGGFLIYGATLADPIPLNSPTLLVERALLPGPANPATPGVGGSLTSDSFNPVTLGLADGMYAGKAALFDYAYNTNIDMTYLPNFLSDALPRDLQYLFVDTVAPQYLGSEMTEADIGAGTVTIGNIKLSGTWPEGFTANDMFGGTDIIDWCDRAFIQWGLEPGVYPNEKELTFSIDGDMHQVWDDVELPGIAIGTPYFYRIVVYDLAGNEAFSSEQTFEWNPMTEEEDLTLWFEAGGTLMTRLEECETFGIIPTGVPSTLYTNLDTADLDPGDYGTNHAPLDAEGTLGTELAQQGPGVKRQDASPYKSEYVDYNVSGNVTFTTHVFPASAFSDGTNVIPLDRLEVELKEAYGLPANGWAAFTGLGIANSVRVAMRRNPLPEENGVDLAFNLRLTPPADTPVGRYSVLLTFVTYQE